MSNLILPPHFIYLRHILSHPEDRFVRLEKELNRQSYTIHMFGKTLMQPRLIAFYADPGVTYTYSHTSLVGKGRQNDLVSIKQAIVHLFPEASSINSVLCNLYRNGQDSMGWHADNEKELGSDPIIYSVTFGANRVFSIMAKKTKEKYNLILEDNSLLVMGKGSQVDYVHSIPKTKKNIGPRINLTFRTIV